MGAGAVPAGRQKSLTRPLRSQSPKRVGSGPAGPPISFGNLGAGLGVGVVLGAASVAGAGSLSGVCVMAILM